MLTDKVRGTCTVQVLYNRKKAGHGAPCRYSSIRNNTTACTSGCRAYSVVEGAILLVQEVPVGLLEGLLDVADHLHDGLALLHHHCHLGQHAYELREHLCDLQSATSNRQHGLRRTSALHTRLPSCLLGGSANFPTFSVVAVVCVHMNAHLHRSIVEVHVRKVDG